MTRTQQPNRRPSIALSFIHGEMQYECTYSIAADLKPFEVFMQVGKAGSELEAMARDMSVVTSLALQHGCPLETIRTALTQGEFDQPAGPLGVLLDRITADLGEIVKND